MLKTGIIIILSILILMLMYRGITQIKCDLESLVDLIRDKYNEMKGK